MRRVFLFLLLSVPARAQTPLNAGPMPGYSAKREASIWLQTKTPATVQLKYWPAGQPAAAVFSKKIQTTLDNDCVARFDQGGLEPGTVYEYDVIVDKKPVPHAVKWIFRTQALWEWRSDPPEFTVAFGSCAYVNETQYDRPGKPYGSDYQIFDSIAEVKPDLMLWLGDNTYLREVDWDSRSGILHRYRHTRSLPELQKLLSSTHHLATWDDHDYGPNNSDRSYPLKDVALETFKQYWPNPTYGLPKASGVFFQVKWADVDFFIIDDRYHRSPNHEKPGAAKTMLGRDQLQWLKDALLASRAPFKIIVSGTQMLNMSGGDESFYQFADERADLLQFIKDNQIWGVVFLSGDVHHGVLHKMVDSDFYPLYDFTSSALTAGLYTPKTAEMGPMMVPGTLVSDQHNFGVLKFSGKFRDRTMIMELHDVTGAVRWSVRINEQDLKPKKP